MDAIDNADKTVLFLLLIGLLVFCIYTDIQTVLLFLSTSENLLLSIFFNWPVYLS